MTTTLALIKADINEAMEQVKQEEVKQHFRDLLASIEDPVWLTAGELDHLAQALCRVLEAMFAVRVLAEDHTGDAQLNILDCYQNLLVEALYLQGKKSARDAAASGT